MNVAARSPPEPITLAQAGIDKNLATISPAPDAAPMTCTADPTPLYSAAVAKIEAALSDLHAAGP